MGGHLRPGSTASNDLLSTPPDEKDCIDLVPPLKRLFEENEVTPDEKDCIDLAPPLNPIFQSLWPIAAK